MLNPEEIKSLKEKIENDEILNFTYVESTNEDSIFSSYKSLIEAESKIEDYLDVIKTQKERVSVNVLHNNQRVRSIFADYLEILKKLERKVIESKEKTSTYRKKIIENFSVAFENSEIS